MMLCGICTKECLREDLTYLALYVVGSEGSHVCLECRMLLTEHVRALKSVVTKSKMLGVKIGRRE
jgi:hypothetical protein